MKSTPIVKRYLVKYYGIYEIALLLVALLELVMLVRGVLRFDFSVTRHALYFCSYALLLVASVVAFILLECNRKRRSKPDFLVGVLYTYSAAIVAWATLLSYLDMTAGNYAAVYQTVIMSVGGLVVMSPYFFGGMALVSSVGLCVSLIAAGRIPERGFLINFVILVVMAVFISIRNYRTAVSEYQSTKELNRLSFTDQLTATHNRRSMDRYLGALHNLDRPYSFMLVDVDNFKTVNDSFGHEVGDRCLIVISTLLRETFSAHIYRYGGDEFAVVSAEMPEEMAKKLTAINEAVREQLADYGVQLSAGIHRRERGENISAVLHKTDRALYAAKSGGKCTAVVYSPILE